MSLFEQGLTSYLSTNVPSQTFYPIHIPEGTPYPCSVYHVMEKEHVNNLSGDSGAVKATVRFYFWGTDYLTVISNAEAVRQVLHGFSGSLGGVTVLYSLLDHEVQDYVQPEDASDLGLFVSSADYSIQYRETIPTLP